MTPAFVGMKKETPVTPAGTTTVAGTDATVGLLLARVTRAPPRAPERSEIRSRKQNYRPVPRRRAWWKRVGFSVNEESVIPGIPEVMVRRRLLGTAAHGRGNRRGRGRGHRSGRDSKGGECLPFRDHYGGGQSDGAAGTGERDDRSSRGRYAAENHAALRAVAALHARWPKYQRRDRRGHGCEHRNGCLHRIRAKARRDRRDGIASLSPWSGSGH